MLGQVGIKLNGMDITQTKCIRIEIYLKKKKKIIGIERDIHIITFPSITFIVGKYNTNVSVNLFIDYQKYIKMKVYFNNLIDKVLLNHSCFQNLTKFKDFNPS